MNSIKGFFLFPLILLAFVVYMLLPLLANANIIEQCKEVDLLVGEANKILKSNPTKAERLYKTALDKCTNNPDLLYNLGLSYYLQGRNGKAVEVFRNALQEAPKHRNAMRMLAYVFVKENIDPVRGKMLSEQLLRMDPNDKAAEEISMLALTGYAPTRKSTVKYSDVDSEISVTRIKKPNAVAVVIGNQYYTDKDIPSVDFAAKDSATIRKYLINVFGFRDANIIYLENATKAHMESVFGTKSNYKGKLFNYLKKKKSEIFIYYSGHGAPDPGSKKGFVIPSDADSKAISLTGYPLQQLYDNIASISMEMKPPQTIVLIDSCFSGQTEKGFLLKNLSPISIEIENPIIRIPNAAVMTSSTGNQVSSWYPEKGHSMFTYFFLKALKDEAGNSKSITVGEIFSLISDESEGVPYYARRIHSRVQTPQLIGNKDIIIVER